MKKAAFLFAFVLTSAVAFSQWKVGIEASGLISRFNYEDESLFDSKYDVGYSAHLFLERRFTDLFGLSFEPGYMVRAGKIDYHGDFQDADGQNLGNDITFSSELGYFVLPVQANFHFLNVVGISAGPEFSVLLSENLKSDFPNVSANQFYDDFSNFEVSGVVGMYVSPLPKLKLVARYAFAFTKSSEVSTGNIMKNASRAQYIQLMARILFN